MASTSTGSSNRPNNSRSSSISSRKSILKPAASSGEPANPTHSRNASDGLTGDESSPEDPVNAGNEAPASPSYKDREDDFQHISSSGSASGITSPAPSESTAVPGQTVLASSSTIDPPPGTNQDILLSHGKGKKPSKWQKRTSTSPEDGWDDNTAIDGSVLEYMSSNEVVRRTYSYSSLLCLNR
jgi:hypothetical protein